MLAEWTCWSISPLNSTTFLPGGGEQHLNQPEDRGRHHSRCVKVSLSLFPQQSDSLYCRILLHSISSSRIQSRKTSSQSGRPGCEVQERLATTTETRVRAEVDPAVRPPACRFAQCGQDHHQPRQVQRGGCLPHLPSTIHWSDWLFWDKLRCDCIEMV